MGSRKRLIASGLRTGKTVGSTKTEYYWNGSQLVGQKQGSSVLQFLYDGSGQLYGFLHNGTPYYYVYNGQGDVVRVLDQYGETEVIYTYDAWGKQLSQKDTAGSSIPSYAASDIANINPIRYRGYYYDIESGFYYLQSRYYDPTTGRFINGDGQINSDMLGGNLFAYCGNNPVNRSDPSGNCYFDENGNWRHDAWEYTGDYEIQPNPYQSAIDGFISEYNFPDNYVLSENVQAEIVALTIQYINGAPFDLGRALDELARQVKGQRNSYTPVPRDPNYISSNIIGQTAAAHTSQTESLTITYEDMLWSGLWGAVKGGAKRLYHSVKANMPVKLVIINTAAGALSGFVKGVVKTIPVKLAEIVWDDFRRSLG